MTPGLKTATWAVLCLIALAIGLVLPLYAQHIPWDEIGEGLQAIAKS